MIEPAYLVNALLQWLKDNALPFGWAALALLLGWYASRLVYRGILRFIARTRGVDATFVPLVAEAARYGILIFAIVTALSFVGVPTASIYAVVGAAGLAIALALQGTLANIAAGIMLVWLRPIAVGEYIVGDGVAGVVVEIGLFATRLRSTSGLYIFTPNQKLWASAITNHSREPRRRIDVNVSAPDSIDVERARQAILAAAVGDARIHGDPRPAVHVDSSAGDRIVLQLRAWVSTPDYLEALRDLTERAKQSVNGVLAGAGSAEAETAPDPHTTMTPGSSTPDLS